MKLLIKVLKIPATESIIFAEALMYVYITKLMLLVFPFRICMRIIKTRKYNKQINQDKLQQIKIAIRRTNYLIFWKNVCLVQSLAACWMLGLRKYDCDLFVGVNFNPERKLIAHAWVMVDDTEVVPRNGHYTTLMTF